MTEKVDRDNVNIIVHEKYEVRVAIVVNLMPESMYYMTMLTNPYRR